MTEEISKSVMGATTDTENSGELDTDTSPEENQGADAPDKSLKGLRAEAIALGFPEVSANAIMSKAPMQAVIDSLQTAKVSTGAVEKVATIEEKPNPREEKQIDKILNSRKGIIYRKLQAQAQVPIFIHKPEDQPEGVVDVVMRRGIKEYVHVSGSVEKFIINGYKIIVPKGVQTTVPKQVYDMWSDSQMLTQRAGQEFLTNRIDSRSGQPVSGRL